ncbi:vWA domain-containing protein [Thermodesulfatator autotrophicus]|uniref:Ice-binding protein C-terminal domain-containing protein n=1 Tax=Thermodesulfatator autotrophicus TaxID=1795632 RepID=A0A177E4V2_9BACT|nr:vWA domain-containing protein [Thermodesulfatator autotrophicus]OAG26935.1 hypothetical protein TH606_09515 [Thermodesulfatator autotrophicus]
MFKKLLVGLSLVLVVLGLAVTNVKAVPEAVDLIFVVDESGSMGGEHTWLSQMVEDLEQALLNVGVGTTIPNRYALVGFGGDNTHEPGHKHLVGGGDWGDVNDIKNAFSSLLTNGLTEDGYDGMEVALTEYDFRANAAVNVILVTDEDRDVLDRNLDYNSILSLFQQKNALLNVVVNHTFFNSDNTQRALGITSSSSFIADGTGGYTEDTNGYILGSGYGTTYDDYVALALALDGAAWDLNILRSGGLDATSFTKAFIDIKVQEIQQQQPIPEPSTVILIGVGLGALGFYRLRKKN